MKIDKDKTYIFKQNPEIDFLFGSANEKIPSKQEGFKPIKGILIENDEQTIINNLYQKRPSSRSVNDFEKMIQKQLISSGFQNNTLNKFDTFEVIITLTMPKNKLYTIDLDNIAKTVLDSIKGYIFEDDSQVCTLICRKSISKLNGYGFLIAITKLAENRKGILKDFWLFKLDSEHKTI